MIEKIKRSLLVNNTKYKRTINRLEKQIDEFLEQNKMLRENNEFLIEQKEKYKKKNRQLKIENEKLKKERNDKNGRSKKN